MRLHVGTSGWQYDWWRDAFYPKATPKRRWLGHYACRFATVEVNNAFYRLPERTTFERWAAGTPDDFTFALKASRFLTHVKRLADPAEPVARMLDRARGLGQKLGPVLLQLPPQLAIALDRLDDALAQFPADQRVAVEFRHPSWFVDECRAVLEDRRARAVPRRSTGTPTADLAHRRLGLRPLPRREGPAVDLLRAGQPRELGRADGRAVARGRCAGLRVLQQRRRRVTRCVTPTSWPWPPGVRASRLRARRSCPRRRTDMGKGCATPRRTDASRTPCREARGQS